MKLIYKSFDELTTKELYELLKVRAEIFVVEQNCVYQDLDDIDYKSIHVFYQNDNGSIIAYLRLFPRDDELNVIQMGRVLTLEHGAGLGRKILHAGIDIAKNRMRAQKIYIEAQKYAAGFYEREGFTICSEEFLEDGIPHVQMELVC